MKEFLKLNYLVTTFFGTGYFPKFPGTFASVVAIIPLLFIPIEWRFISVFSAVVLLSIFSLPLIASVEKEKGNDSSIIVIDEVIGV
jgi:phosphatidylglycerophosphatase A